MREEVKFLTVKIKANTIIIHEYFVSLYIDSITFNITFNMSPQFAFL